IGWNGPYLTSGRATFATYDSTSHFYMYGQAGDPTVFDGWGNPIVIRAYSTANPTIPQPNKLPTLNPPTPHPPSLTFLTIANGVLVSAGPDGDLSTDTDNVTLKIR